MRPITLLLLTPILIITLACRQSDKHIASPLQDSTRYQLRSAAELNQHIETKEIAEEEKQQTADCKYEDGTYPASVTYHNPKTNHTAQYELQVHIKDCQLIQIDFPHGGWLDEDHIPATDITREGKAALKDDKGRNWKIQLH